MTWDFLVKARILVNEAELESDELKSPVRPNVRKADLPTQHYLDRLKTSRRSATPQVMIWAVDGQTGSWLPEATANSA
jgi:hypothetical protein